MNLFTCLYAIYSYQFLTEHLAPIANWSPDEPAVNTDLDDENIVINKSKRKDLTADIFTIVEEVIHEGEKGYKCSVCE